MNRKNITRSTIASGITAALIGGHAGFSTMHSASVHAATPPAVSAQQVATPAPIQGVAPTTTFAGIVQQFGPAVVNISVTGKSHQVPTSEQQDGNGQGDLRDPLSQFFRNFPNQRPPGAESGPPSHGLGSGFIISPDGTILTNAHVVDGAQEVVVKLTDRREFKAKVLGVDKLTDVAVLKIKATDLPVVRLGNPAATRVGDPVLAIGSPYGFENTATSGIVSAKGRALPDGAYVPFIQTDVAVNPGNSGGPLFNMQGEVIGINSQIYSRTGGYQGLSFAIPIDVAANVEKQLTSSGKVSRGRLGVSVQELTQSLGDSFGLKTVHGALVSMVESGGPADKAGLQPGDVIIKVGDHDVNYSADLPAQIAMLKPGTSTRLEVIRKGKPTSVEVTLGALGETNLASAGKEDTIKPGKLGVAVRPLSPQEQRDGGVHSGLLVEQVTGRAERAGIQPGDVIVSVNGTPVSSVQKLQGLVEKAGQSVALLVQRENNQIFVPIDMG
jgi:serine protease Do